MGLSVADTLRFYKVERRIRREFEEDSDINDFLNCFVSIGAFEKLELEDEVRVLKDEVAELEYRIEELKRELKEVEEELSTMTDDYEREMRLNVYLLNENSVLKARLEQLRQED